MAPPDAVGTPDAAAGAPAAEERAQQFYRAAEPLLARYGLRKTTVEEICHAAGASKRTFYELFRDKQDLVVQMLAWLVDSALREGVARREPGMSSVAQLEAFIDGYEAFARQHPVFQECSHEEASQRLEFGRQIHARLQCLRDALGAIIAAGIASGEFRPVDTAASVLILDGMLDAMYYVYPKLTGSPGALDDPVLARELKAFIINGLCHSAASSGRSQR